MIRSALAFCAMLAAAACTEGAAQSPAPYPQESASPSDPVCRSDLAVARRAFAAEQAWFITVMDLDGRRYEFFDACPPPDYEVTPQTREIEASLAFTVIRFDRGGDRCYDLYDTSLGELNRSDWARACEKDLPGDETISSADLEAARQRPKLDERIRKEIGIPGAIVAEVYTPDGVQRFWGELGGDRLKKLKAPEATRADGFYPQPAVSPPLVTSYTATLFTGSQCVDYVTGDGRICRYCQTSSGVTKRCR